MRIVPIKYDERDQSNYLSHRRINALLRQRASLRFGTQRPLFIASTDLDVNGRRRTLRDLQANNDLRYCFPCYFDEDASISEYFERLTTCAHANVALARLNSTFDFVFKLLMF